MKAGVCYSFIYFWKFQRFTSQRNLSSPGSFMILTILDSTTNNRVYHMLTLRYVVRGGKGEGGGGRGGGGTDLQRKDWWNKSLALFFDFLGWRLAKLRDLVGQCYATCPCYYIRVLLESVNSKPFRVYLIMQVLGRYDVISQSLWQLPELYF